jgi:hypothetical protein
MSINKHYPNHPSVDQSDRTVPRNLRQTGGADVDLLICTRVRKSPFWHPSVEEGVRQATIYNDMYHPRAYIDLEEGGLEAEYELLVNDVPLMKIAGEPIREWAPDFWLVSDPETGKECGYLTSVWWNPELETSIGLGYVPAEKLQAATAIPLDDSIYDADVDVEFEAHLPAEYAEVSGEPVYATLATVPFKESVNPSAREQAKIHTVGRNSVSHPEAPSAVFARLNG